MSSLFLMSTITDRRTADAFLQLYEAHGVNVTLRTVGTGMEGAAPFLGMELVNEKELVLIVSRTAQKNRIMKAIMDGADRRAGAIVFSLPVTDTAGLRLLEEEEPAAK